MKQKILQLISDLEKKRLDSPFTSELAQIGYRAGINQALNMAHMLLTQIEYEEIVEEIKNTLK